MYGSSCKSVTYVKWMEKIESWMNIRIDEMNIWDRWDGMDTLGSSDPHLLIN
jgi:hypothetical protein